MKDVSAFLDTCEITGCRQVLSVLGLAMAGILGYFFLLYTGQDIVGKKSAVSFVPWWCL